MHDDNYVTIFSFFFVLDVYLVVWWLSVKFSLTC